MWPLIVDGVIVVATVSVVALSGHRRRRSAYPWALLIGGAVVSVAANASRAVIDADPAVPSVLAAAVAAVPPVVLVAITHLTVELTRPRPGPAIPTGPAPTDAPARAEYPKRTRHDRADTGRDTAAAAGGEVSGRTEALRLRAETTWTNRKIAARLGVHPSTVGRWLHTLGPAGPETHEDTTIGEEEHGDDEQQ